MLVCVTDPILTTNTVSVLTVPTEDKNSATHHSQLCSWHGNNGDDGAAGFQPVEQIEVHRLASGL